MDIPAAAVSSRAGITIGGWEMMRYRPSTSSASFESACRLSLVRAFSATFFAPFSPLVASFFALPEAVRVKVLIAAISSCSDRWAYQISIVLIWASSAIASRYARTEASVAARVSALEKLLLRAAIVKLADIRIYVVFERPGERLVEVVHIEQEIPLGRCKTRRSSRGERRRRAA